ncbi:MAG TPA: hypothetical protein VFP84_39595, partial [Kofleriaceae bacterium]|nr:hypothetical protein [Kofleriaceae bacterium]
PRTRGRPTGMLTAIAAPGVRADVPELGRAATMVAPVAPAVVATTNEPAAAAGQATHVPAMKRAAADDDAPPPRRRALPIALAVIVLAVAGGGVALLRSKPEPIAEVAPVPVTPPRPMPIDAAVIVPANDAMNDARAEVPIDVIVDAGEPPADAAVTVPGRRRTVHPAPPRPAPAPTPPPPPAEVVPAGTGKLTALHKAGSAYLMVMIDGRFFANTPMYGEAIPTGTHTIELVDVTTRKAVAHRTVTVHPDDKLTIEP